jgi:hypothetical protein
LIFTMFNTSSLISTSLSLGVFTLFSTLLFALFPHESSTYLSYFFLRLLLGFWSRFPSPFLHEF